jgi:hypothetical protein
MQRDLCRHESFFQRRSSIKLIRVITCNRGGACCFYSCCIRHTFDAHCAGKYFVENHNNRCPNLKVANTDDIRGNIAMVIRRLLENHDCSIPSFRQFSELSVCSFLADALAAVSNDTARLAICNCVSLLFDTAAQSVEMFSQLQMTELRQLCTSKGILTSRNRNDKIHLLRF